MVILQLGKAKSGNFWMYRILQEALDICKIQKKSYAQQHPIYDIAKTWDLSHDQQAGMDVISIAPDIISLRIGNNFKEEIKDFDKYLSKCTHVWSHSMWNENSRQTYKKFDKIIYIVRDPRDIALSMAKFAFTPYMLGKRTHREIDPASYLQNRIYGSTLSWVQHVGQHLLRKDELNIHFVFYERLLHSFDQEVLELLGYLDLELSKSELQMLKDKVSFRTMKEQFPQHVRKGSSYKWVGVLSGKQVSIVRDIAGPILKTLNYPMDDRLENYELPKLPTSLNPVKINRALKASKGGLSTKLQYIYYFAKSRRPMREKVEKAVKFFLSKPVQ